MDAEKESKSVPFVEYNLKRKGVACMVKVKDSVLSWETIHTGNVNCLRRRKDSKCLGLLRIDFILDATCDLQNPKCQKDETILTIHFVQYQPKRILRVKQLILQGDYKQCQDCAEDIKRKLNESECHRPKKLLVFINPKSGKRCAEKIFKKKVLPLFNLAGIKIHSVVTERRGHIGDVLSSTDLTTFDGIVCLGGDGTFSEVVNSYLRLVYHTEGVHLNNPDAELPRPSLPIGIIPTGSGDTIIRFAHETRSVTTATLHIILGKSKGLDVTSLHQETQLLAYCCLLAGYGLYGRLIQSIEARRWIPGWLRYSVVPLVELLHVKEFGAKVDLLNPIPPHQSPPSRNTTTEAQKIHQNKDVPTKPKESFERTDSSTHENNRSKCFADGPEQSTNKNSQSICIDDTSVYEGTNGKVGPIFIYDNPVEEKTNEMSERLNPCDSPENDSSTNQNAQIPLTCLEIRNERTNERTKTKEPLCPSDSNNTTIPKEVQENNWVHVEGTLLGIDMFVTQLMPKGKSLRPYLGNGLGQLTLVKPCSRRQHFSHLVKLMNRTPGFYDFNFIEEHWVKGYRLSCQSLREGDEVPEIFLMNCDGDLLKLDKPTAEVRVHQELIQLYTWTDEEEKYWPS